MALSEIRSSVKVVSFRMMKKACSVVLLVAGFSGAAAAQSSAGPSGAGQPVGTPSPAQSNVNAGAVQAQPQAPARTTTPTDKAVAATTNDAAGPAPNLAKAAEEYKSALTNLAALYEIDLKRLADHNIKMKELFDKGIVARVELENSEAAVAQAQAKIDSVHRQIESAEAAQTSASWNGSGALAVQWSTGDGKLDGLIRHYGEAYGVDPFLVYCVARQESGFTASAVSPKGARGVMQLMPDTAARYGVTSLFDVEQNIRAGVHYLKDLLQRFNGNVDLALAGYNAGEGAVIRNGNTVPPIRETQYYVRSIGKRYSARPQGTQQSVDGSSKKKKSTKPAGPVDPQPITASQK